MELVYLWVEDYKNIHRQGFNFSSKFECTFHDKYKNDDNGNEKLENNCKLDIKKNENYVSIFPDKINMTAIVGKNGSGKSNILEILSNQESDHTIIKVFLDKKNLIYTINTNLLIETIAHKNEIQENTIFYTEIPSNNSLNNTNITNISLWNDVQNEGHDKISVNLNIVKNRMQTSHMILMKRYDFLQGIYKRPQNIEFSFNHYYFDNIDHDNYDEIWIRIFKILIDRDYSEYEQADDIDEYLSFYDGLNINEIKKHIKRSITNEETLKWINERIELSDVFMKNYKKLLQKKDIEVERLKSKVISQRIDDAYEDGTLEKYITTFRLLIPFRVFSIDFLNSIENLFSYSREELIITLKWDITLSTGEESFLNLFASLYNCFKKHGYAFQHINLIIDEIEAYLHPDWQKKFLDYFIKFFQQKGINDDRNTNIILTTHSPFILSDLPKKNVIFLDKVDEKTQVKYPKLNIDGLENGNCINVSNHLNIKPFCANIHTLLSHGFFMDSGLMGEFAKSKINEILNFHNIIKKKRHLSCLKKIYIHSKQTQFWHIHNIIGEEYLKQVIKNHLIEIEKEMLGKDEAKNAEIARVKAYLESLEND